MKNNKTFRIISAVLSTITVAALTSVSAFAATAGNNCTTASVNSKTIAKIYANGNKINCNDEIQKILNKYKINIPSSGTDCNKVWKKADNGNTTQPPAGNTTQPPADNTTQPPVEAPASADSSVLAIEREVVTLVNAIRAQNGLSALTLNEELSAVARVKAEDMAQNKYFSHTSPTYGSPFDMMKKFGISYRTAGENIAMGYSTAQSVVDGWMNSPGHRANILNASFTQIGVGYTANGNYWCQMFIG